jgi:carbamoylphosphate synthase small subunit
MGHQILGQAFGATTFKLSFGHHGGNHPIRDMDTGKVQISAQNHNFAVDPATLPKEVRVSHINLNDGVPLLSGLRLRTRVVYMQNPDWILCSKLLPSPFFPKSIGLFEEDFSHTGKIPL